MSSGRHAKIIVEYPEWVDRLRGDSCLRSVAEDAYYAQALAIRKFQAQEIPSCRDTLRAAQKAIKRMEDSGMSQEARCKAGDQAARKFWEAKVCARQRRAATR